MMLSLCSTRLPAVRSLLSRHCKRGRAMGIRSALTACLMFCFALFVSSRLVQGSVTYDRKSLVINGQRRILLSGSIHYPRSTPEMWPDLMRNAKSGGLDVIDTYVFWNVHQPSPNSFNFGGRYDLVKFIRTAQKEGLYVSLRIGPYVCAEWNFGGFPVWLKNVPGISFRTDNEPFKIAMQGFVEKVVGLLRSEYLFEPQGGNIILTQIENEYGHLEQIYGTAGHDYMTWAANMAVQQGTGVPWVMCKQEDAPDPVINTCNGFYCDTFSPNKPYKPAFWTEAWTGWFGAIGGPTHQRHVQDLAFAVAQFIQKGGSFVNYYMYHGGTNFGRTGAPLITTSYDYDAPIDEYGLIRQPKYGHLKELHRAVKMCERAIVLADPIITPLGEQQQAYVYYPDNGVCAAFLSNHDTVVARVMFNNMHYNLPPSSISILPDCKNVVFNTAKVGVQTSRVEMLPSKANTFFWEVYNDDIPLADDRSTFTSYGLLEQINVTRDVSDYLWYITNVDISSREEFLNGGEWHTLIVESAGHALLVFVNGQFSGSASGNAKNKRFTFVGKVNLHAGTNRIALLSVTSGLQNRGSHFETWSLGVTGPVLLHGIGRGTMDLSSQKWTYKVGLKGEAMNLASVDSAFSVDWMQDSLAVQKSYPLTWYKAKINAPEGDEPLALDFASMGKGQAWINGQSIGRYNLASAAGTCDSYSYSVRYQPEKFQTNCGSPTQRWYHVPRSWLNPTDNQLVLLEELGGNPATVSLAKRSVTGVCAHISESHPTSKNWHGNPEGRHPPKVVLLCGASQIITSIQFASYGTPLGTCGSFRQGPCHSPISTAVLAQKCVGRTRCSVAVSSNKFGPDPCPDTLKWLAVEAACSLK